MMLASQGDGDKSQMRLVLEMKMVFQSLQPRWTSITPATLTYYYVRVLLPADVSDRDTHPAAAAV